MTAFDFESLTIGETIEIEEITGAPVNESLSKGKPRGKAALAYMFIMERRKNPNITLDEVKNMNLMDFFAQFEDDADPKEQDS